MRHRIFNDDGDEDLVFVMGWATAGPTRTSAGSSDS